MPSRTANRSTTAAPRAALSVEELRQRLRKIASDLRRVEAEARNLTLIAPPPNDYWLHYDWSNQERDPQGPPSLQAFLLFTARALWRDEDAEANDARPLHTLTEEIEEAIETTEDDLRRRWMIAQEPVDRGVC